MEVRIGNRYRLGRKIGSGSFGDIYLGRLCIIYIYIILKFNNYTLIAIFNLHNIFNF